MTFPEVLNEPVFHADPAVGGTCKTTCSPRSAPLCPPHTIVLTGQDWGGIAGLLALPPAADPNVVYSFHFYDPAELTSLAAYRPGLDRAALARLPFPQADPGSCGPAAGSTTDQATRDLILFYCATDWDAAHFDSPDCQPSPGGPSGTGSLCWRANLVPASRSTPVPVWPGCVWCGKPARPMGSDGRSGAMTT